VTALRATAAELAPSRHRGRPAASSTPGCGARYSAVCDWFAA